MSTHIKQRGIPYLVEGVALLSLLLLIVFALQGNVAGRAVYTNKACKEGATVMSCVTDETGTFLMELSCEHNVWRELMTKCDCRLGERGVYCA